MRSKNKQSETSLVKTVSKQNAFHLKGYIDAIHSEDDPNKLTVDKRDKDENVTRNHNNICQLWTVYVENVNYVISVCLDMSARYYLRLRDDADLNLCSKHMRKKTRGVKLIPQSEIDFNC